MNTAFILSLLSIFAAALHPKGWYIPDPPITGNVDLWNLNTVYSSGGNLNQDQGVCSIYFYFQANQTYLDGAIQLRCKENYNTFSWAGIGFGTGMLDAYFILCHNNDNGTTAIHEHTTAHAYSKPTTFIDKTMVSKAGNYSINNNQTLLTCTFTRPLMANSTNGYSIVNQNMVEIIWAYNPNSNPDSNPGPNPSPFIRHDSSMRGALYLNLHEKGKNAFTPRDNVKDRYLLLSLHGYIMMSAFLFIFPLGVLLARHFKTLDNWIYGKVMFQLSGFTLAIVALFICINTGVRFDSLHSVVGTTLLSLCAIQIIFGFSIAINQSTSDGPPPISAGHKMLGYSMLAFAVVQVGFGINILSPWNNPNDITLWIILFVFLGMWLIVFISLGIRRHMDTLKVESVEESERLLLLEPIINASLDRKQDNLTYTWKMIDNEIRDGRMLVVHGHFIHDISKWMNTHPGGKKILKIVNGTDISNDYFNDNEYDINKFNFDLKIPKSFQDSNNLNSFRNYSMTLGLDYREWNHIHNARRLHVHSEQAAKKMAHLTIGRLDESYDTNYKYRRYTIVSRDEFTMNNRTSLRLKFSHLFPEEDPVSFYIGSCVEIQIQLSNGEFVSRFYTPINGNMEHFEIIVHIVDEGLMSNYLMRSRAGESQFKIRGPFGARIFEPISIPQTIFYIVGGSGITPALQACSLFYQPDHVLTALFPNENQGQLRIQNGDRIKICENFHNGYAFGFNYDTMESGLFPIGSLSFQQTAKVVIIYLNNTKIEYFQGREILEGVKETNPNYVDFFSITYDQWYEPELVQMFSQSTDSMIVVSGSPDMNEFVRNSLNDRFSGPVKILDPNSFAIE